MKDSSLTLRLPTATRRRIEQFAMRESRSLSQATQRLIELGLAAAQGGSQVVAEPGMPWSTAPPVLAGALAGGLVPTLDDFRAARQALSASLDKRTRADARPRR